MKTGNDSLHTESSHVPFKFVRRRQCCIHVKIHPDHCIRWSWMKPHQFFFFFKMLFKLSIFTAISLAFPQKTYIIINLHYFLYLPDYFLMLKDENKCILRAKFGLKKKANKFWPEVTLVLSRGITAHRNWIIAHCVLLESRKIAEKL